MMISLSESQCRRAYSVPLLAVLLGLSMAGSFSVDAGDPDPAYFQRRGVVTHVAGGAMMTVRARMPEVQLRRSAESTEQYFLGRQWIIRNDEGETVATFRCLRVQEDEGGLQLSGLYTATEEALPRAGMEFGEYLRAERTDPPARIVTRRKERPSRLRSEADGKEMVLIGEDYLVFGQGLDPSADSFNPRFFERTVTATPRIKAFYMDRTEVTNAEYYRFCRRTRRGLPREWKGGYPSDRADEPFLFARYVDAIAYARWADKRLPTEFEWELAARGGLRSRHDEDSFEGSPTSYPQGDSSGCNTIESWVGRAPAPLRVNELKDATSAGIVGLCGNAPEWTSSFFVPYPGHRFKNSDGKLRRVIRGGAYYLPLEQARAESRIGASPDGPVRAGFRLVMDLP